MITYNTFDMILPGLPYSHTSTRDFNAPYNTKQRNAALAIACVLSKIYKTYPHLHGRGRKVVFIPEITVIFDDPTHDIQQRFPLQFVCEALDP